jgi:hypothetical protein
VRVQGAEADRGLRPDGHDPRGRALAALAAEARAKRLGYYEYVASPPQPSLVVIQDLDPSRPGRLLGRGEHGDPQGPGPVGCITNGSIRDLDMIAPEFQLLAGKVGPSHVWVHVVDTGLEVTVHGMTVRHGDLIHADRHGAVVIPPEAVEGMPAAIELMSRREAPILAEARASGFTVERLKAAMAEADEIH